MAQERTWQAQGCGSVPDNKQTNKKMMVTFPGFGPQHFLFRNWLFMVKLDLFTCLVLWFNVDCLHIDSKGYIMWISANAFG